MSETTVVLDTLVLAPTRQSADPGPGPTSGVDLADLDGLAEAIECARYENMAKVRWRGLRDGERQTRTALMRRTLDTAGISDVLRDLQARADRSDELGRLAAHRDRQLAGQRADHAAEVATLAARLTALDALLADAIDERRAAQARADDAEATIAAVVRALDRVK